MPTPEQIAKTKFGIVTDFATLFTDFAYVGESGRSPVRHDWPDGFYFLSTLYGPPQIEKNFNRSSDPIYPGRRDLALCAKPTDKVRDAVLDRALEGRIGSFEINVWKHDGHALVLGTDSTMIAKVWLAFVPLDCFPTINPDNTRIIQGDRHARP